MIYALELHGKVHDRDYHDIHSYIHAPTGLSDDRVDNIIDKFSTSFELVSIKTSHQPKKNVWPA